MERDKVEEIRGKIMNILKTRTKQLIGEDLISPLFWEDYASDVINAFHAEQSRITEQSSVVVGFEKGTGEPITKDLSNPFEMRQPYNNGVVTVSERTEALLNQHISCHPSQENNLQLREAVKFLAKQIDTLHKLRIAKKGDKK